MIGLILLLGFSSLVFATECDIDNTTKVDCGKVGTTEGQCLENGCCWKPSPGSPWCFFPRGAGNCFFVQRFQDPKPPFNSTELGLMKSFFLKNININQEGGVVASPDRNTPGGSYYFHWERDGALSMRALMTISTPEEYVPLMKSYVQWVLRVQSESDPHSQDVRIEPKYLLPNGTVYPGSWCRPQTDGPALRATTLMIFANYLIQSGQTDFVKEYLWTFDPSSYHGGAIKYDLDWVYQNWGQNGCDLWEELESDDFFFNRLNFKRALFMGSVFAKDVGDEQSSSLYLDAGQAVNSTLFRHYNGQYVFESDNRKKDAAVIVAFNDGFDSSIDDMFSPSSEEVANTIDTLNELFCTSYPINRKDTQANVPGVLYGRYEGDIYAGGNPWVLTTGALAELFYRGASEMLEKDANQNIWRRILGIDDNEDVVQAMTDAGDSVMLRIKYHVAGNGFHLNEQIDKSSGFEMAAKNLTWSYATVLKAAYYRDVAMKKIKSLKK